MLATKTLQKSMIYLQILSQEHKGNLVISPISVKLLLGMVMEGADGKTAEEIRAALRMPRNREAARKEFETWLSLLQVGKTDLEQIYFKVYTLPI